MSPPHPAVGRRRERRSRAELPTAPRGEGSMPEPRARATRGRKTTRQRSPSPRRAGSTQTPADERSEEARSTRRPEGSPSRARGRGPPTRPSAARELGGGEAPPPRHPHPRNHTTTGPDPQDGAGIWLCARTPPRSGVIVFGGVDPGDNRRPRRSGRVSPPPAPGDAAWGRPGRLGTGTVTLCRPPRSSPGCPRLCTGSSAGSSTRGSVVCPQSYPQAVNTRGDHRESPITRRDRSQGGRRSRAPAPAGGHPAGIRTASVRPGARCS